MTVQGKSLQDIYDEGSKRLDGSEQLQQKILQEDGKSGVEELGHIESAMLTKMDKSVADLEVEIHGYLDKAVEGINAAVDSEVEENRKFLERLQETLKLSCQTLSEDVKQLRDSMLQKFNANAEQSLSLHQREFEKGLAQLKANGGGAVAHLKERALVGNAGFSSRGSTHVLNALDKNFKVPGEFFVEFSRHAISIDKRLNDCLQLLTARSKEIIADVNGDGTQAQSSLDQVVQQLAAEMESVYRNSEAQLQKHCEDALSAALLHQEELSNELKTELLESHQSSSGITEKSLALKIDTDHLLEQVKQLLEDVDKGVRANCESSNDNFDKSLSERLESAKQHSQLVAEERSQLMEHIAGDLQEIESSFNLRLSQLADKCQARLSSICVDAERAIVSTHDVCAAEFKSLSAQQKKSIEDKTLQLLRNIDTLSQQAVQNIRTAAGDSGTQPLPLQAAALAQMPGGPISEAQPLQAQMPLGQTTPLHMAAVQAAPEQSVPAQAAPIQPAPTQAAPAQSMPAQSMPPQPAPAVPEPGSAEDTGMSEPNVPSTPSNPFGDFGEFKL